MVQLSTYRKRDSYATKSDWRSQLQPEARQRIVDKIMDTLKRHLPVAVPEGMSELKKIAVRFEEKIYTAAVNQSDYLRKISLRMLSMETKTQQNTPINPQPGFKRLKMRKMIGRTLKQSRMRLEKKHDLYKDPLSDESAKDL